MAQLVFSLIFWFFMQINNQKHPKDFPPTPQEIYLQLRFKNQFISSTLRTARTATCMKEDIGFKFQSLNSQILIVNLLSVTRKWFLNHGITG